MAGIAAAKVGADGGPGAAPEARQVARDLDWTIGRRKQVKGERNASAGQRGMLVEPEQLLDAQRDRRSAFRFIVDRRRGPGRGLEERWGLVNEAPRQIPGQRGVEGVREIIGANLVEFRLADKERREPARISRQRLVR
jgi:hypothetical protein